MSIIFAVILFSFLIFIHELGHFTAAKSFGVQVNEFSVFMGPALWKKKIGETLYAIRCIPIGGYCAMEGEDGGSDNPRSFSAAAWWKKMIILVAGAAMNFIIGVILLAIFLAPDESFIVPVVSEVDPGCSFYGENGILPGDQILAVDGEQIYTYNDFTLILSINESDRHDLAVQRDGKKLQFKDVLMERRPFANEDGTTSLRYGFSFSVVDASFTETFKMVMKTTADTVRLVRLSLKMLVNGQAGYRDVSGPVGIVVQMAEVADSSGSMYYALLNLVYFGGFIAINLAVMNLLPIPALDGGRVASLLLTTIIEAITKKKINPKYEGYIHSAGMLILLIIMALIMFKDIIFAIRR